MDTLGQVNLQPGSEDRIIRADPVRQGLALGGRPDAQQVKATDVHDQRSLRVLAIKRPCGPPFNHPLCKVNPEIQIQMPESHPRRLRI